MELQCQGCGAFESTTCAHCPSVLCARCKAGHEPVCEQIQKRKKLGLGPTVRENRVYIPTAAPLEPVDQGLKGIADLLSE